METLTIKLLHERHSRRQHRKCDGMSGKLYAFTWSDEHSAYCFTTSKQEEVDDLFNSQGRAMGSYFAPVITLKQPQPATDPTPTSPPLPEPPDIESEPVVVRPFRKKPRDPVNE